MEWHADKPHNLALERALSMASSNGQQQHQLTARHTHHMHVCFEPPKTETTSNKRRQNRYGDRLTLVTSSPAPQICLQNGHRKHKLNNAHNAPRTAGGLLCGRNIPFASLGHTHSSPGATGVRVHLLSCGVRVSFKFHSTAAHKTNSAVVPLHRKQNTTNREKCLSLSGTR